MNFFLKIVIKIFELFYPVKFYNKKNIPQGTAVVVCNHFRAIDCGFLKDIFPKKSYFLAKGELFKNKFVGWVIKSCGAIPINRDAPSLSSMLQATKVLKNGNKLIIFPEGTRNKTNDVKLLPIKSGSAVFAVKSKCPIVPIMQLKKAKLFRKTKIIIGEPFDLSEFYDKKLTEENIAQMDNIVRANMENQYEKLASIVAKKGKRK